ncbi:NAD(P)-binding protein [Lentithecium fluviatile CBS 122367]|uniref:NAD(P)-binding protein n=1 Tax=Lentithecium fluviatile CBS 122367 TaxID=1168545 RepID=A0A6G1J7G6_9PLEO|nr:NAD(P)-binding protein [Lentithecium fluviatile CBS 122367]
MPPKTAIITGGANGIGAQTIRTYHARGYNVVIADLPSAYPSAETLICSLSETSCAMFHPTNIVDWSSMQSLFRETKRRFGQVDVVVANAGLMESRGFFEFEENEHGELREDVGSAKVVDVNLRGTMNTLRLAMHAMKSNTPDENGFRGSIVLIASTSGYFGGTGVVSYISSKHGVVGLARASQRVANQLNIRVNVVAPFFTPTYITGGYSEEWKKRGLPANTVEDVANGIVETSEDTSKKGAHVMVAGKFVREIESARTSLTKKWLGEDIAGIMAKGGKFFEDMGGYTLPKLRE